MHRNAPTSAQSSSDATKLIFNMWQITGNVFL